MIWGWVEVGFKFSWSSVEVSWVGVDLSWVWIAGENGFLKGRVMIQVHFFVYSYIKETFVFFFSFNSYFWFWRNLRILFWLYGTQLDYYGGWDQVKKDFGVYSYSATNSIFYVSFNSDNWIWHNIGVVLAFWHPNG